MKGPTHNLTVRTRTDVALYVLNHKRGHLRDLENSFKVTLAVIADATISGQQSFVIDRGEAVHTLEAAKAISPRSSRLPAVVEDTYDYGDDETFEAEAEFEGDDDAEGESDGDEAQSASSPSEGEGPRRKRRRRRRGRGGETREGAQAGERSESAGVVPQDETVEAGDTDEGDDEQDETNGEARAEQGRMASAARAAAVAVVAVAVGAMAKLARAMAPSRVKGSSRR
jgi:ribonuclease E